MARVLLNPTFLIETGELLSHDGESHVEQFPIRFDRGAVSQAKSQGEQAAGVAGSERANANIDRSSVIPGLIQDATHPTGFTPQQKNNLLVAGQEAVGGGNAAATGEGRLAAMRSRTAGGFAPALAEIARQKGRTLASNAVGVSNEDARLAQEKQQQARSQLLGLYGTDTSSMLKGMGLQSEDLQNQLAAGRQGWLQNTEGVLNTLGNLGSSAAGVKKAFG